MAAASKSSGLAGIQAKLNHKIGPLPLWGYGAVAVGGWFVYKHFVVPGTASDAAQVAADMGAPAGAGGIIGGGGGGSSGGGDPQGGHKPGPHHKPPPHHHPKPGGGPQHSGGNQHNGKGGGGQGGGKSHGDTHHPGLTGPPTHKQGTDGKVKHLHGNGRPPHPGTSASRAGHSTRERIDQGSAGGGSYFSENG